MLKQWGVQCAVAPTITIQNSKWNAGMRVWAIASTIATRSSRDADFNGFLSELIECYKFQSSAAIDFVKAFDLVQVLMKYDA